MVGGSLEAALTVAADFDQVLQDLSFCAFGHDSLRAPITKSGSLDLASGCARCAPVISDGARRMTEEFRVRTASHR